MTRPVLAAPILQAARHYTITNIVPASAERRPFGFAISDDGEEIYLPAIVVNKAGLTPEDVGEGFLCLTYAANEQHRYPRAAMPVYLDRDHPTLKTLTLAEPGETPLSARVAAVDALLNGVINDMMKVRALLAPTPPE